jgi:hypothetical protein
MQLGKSDAQIRSSGRWHSNAFWNIFALTILAKNTVHNTL